MNEALILSDWAIWPRWRREVCSSMISVCMTPAGNWCWQVLSNQWKWKSLSPRRVFPFLTSVVDYIYQLYIIIMLTLSWKCSIYWNTTRLVTAIFPSVSSDQTFYSKKMDIFIEASFHFSAVNTHVLMKKSSKNYKSRLLRILTV